VGDQGGVVVGLCGMWGAAVSAREGEESRRGEGWCWSRGIFGV